MSLRLSIVIAAWNGGSLLQQCLESLKEQGQAGDTEVIVVSNDDGRSQEMLKLQFPFVKHVSLPPDTTVPVLRAAGVARSNGEIVTLLEDHCSLDARWCAEIKKAHELPYAVIGGPIENTSPHKSLNWAVYFYDYGKYMLPAEAQVVGSLSGMNVSYKRAVLAEVEHLFREGFFEVFVHEELERRGHALYLTPAAIVYLKKDYALGSTLVQFYHQARCFASKRVSKAALAKRIAFGVGAVLLPVLLPTRIIARTVRKRRHLKQLFTSLPCLVLLMTSWGAGEFCGYLFGEGSSGEKWK
jgi:glycosyltransferase involved in cell wall biosynthesis